MPTKRPRLSINVHRYTHRTLRAYGKAHKLSLSSLCVTGAFLLARMLEREKVEDVDQRDMEEDEVRDLFAAYPDYAPEVVTKSLRRQLTAIGKTIATVRRPPPPELPELPPNRAIDEKVDALWPEGKELREKAAKDDKLAREGLPHFYDELSVAMKELDTILRRSETRRKKSAHDNQKGHKSFSRKRIWRSSGKTKS